MDFVIETDDSIHGQVLDGLYSPIRLLLGRNAMEFLRFTSGGHSISLSARWKHLHVVVAIGIADGKRSGVLFSSQPQATRFVSRVRLRLTAKHDTVAFTTRVPIVATMCRCIRLGFLTKKTRLDLADEIALLPPNRSSERNES